MNVAIHEPEAQNTDV